MKKKILAAFLSCSIILSGCSIPNIGLGGDDTESEDQDDKDEDDSEKEDTDQDESDEDLSDPNAMVFGDGHDLLGTLSYYGAFKVGDDGLPEFAGDFYTISWVCGSGDITAKVDIEAQEVDEDGTVKGATTVTAGSVVTPVRTDGETFLDYRLEDGSLVRFTYSNTSYPISINGSELNDLFENLCFAG